MVVEEEDDAADEIYIKPLHIFIRIRPRRSNRTTHQPGAEMEKVEAYGAAATAIEVRTFANPSESSQE